MYDTEQRAEKSGSGHMTSVPLTQRVAPPSPPKERPVADMLLAIVALAILSAALLWVSSLLP